MEGEDEQHRLQGAHRAHCVSMSLDSDHGSRCISVVQLTNTATKAVAAESHRATYGILTAKRDLRLEVMDPELVPFLDAVVLSFVICQKEEYYDTVERSDTIATVADAGATVAVAAT